jgi:hypothetical protein
MWIIQEPKKITLWNKRHFEEKNGRVCSMFKILSTYNRWKKYIKCSIWRVAICPSYILDTRFLKVNLVQLTPSIAFYQSIKQTLSSSSISKVRSDIILSIPIASLVSFPLGKRIPNKRHKIITFCVLECLQYCDTLWKRKWIIWDELTIIKFSRFPYM